MKNPSDSQAVLPESMARRMVRETPTQMNGKVQMASARDNAVVSGPRTCWRSDQMGLK